MARCPAPSLDGRGGQRASRVTEARSAAGGGRWPFWLPVGVLLVGLLVTGVLVWISASTYSSNEKRLLNLRVRDAGALIAEALPSVQTPLASAAALADATDGDVAKFKKFIGPSVAAKTVRIGLAVAAGRRTRPGRSPWSARPPMLGGLALAGGDVLRQRRRSLGSSG